MEQIESELMMMVVASSAGSTSQTSDSCCTDTLGERCKWSLIRNGEQSFARE